MLQNGVNTKRVKGYFGVLFFPFLVLLIAGSSSLFDEEISCDKEGDKENEEDNSHLPTFASGKHIVKREEETKV